jgi:hypothetical protein
MNEKSMKLMFPPSFGIDVAGARLNPGEDLIRRTMT